MYPPCILTGLRVSFGVLLLLPLESHLVYTWLGELKVWGWIEKWRKDALLEGSSRLGFWVAVKELIQVTIIQKPYLLCIPVIVTQIKFLNSNPV